MPIVSSLCKTEHITTKDYGYRSPLNIQWIVPHHMTARWTGDYAAQWFCTNGKSNSVNYCIGYDGDIACNVYEENGAWTSGHFRVDERAITIECADTSSTNYRIPEATQESLIQLMVDIFKRYPSLGGRAIFDPTDETEVVNAKLDKRVPKTKGNILLHRWVQAYATTCPEWHMTQIMPDIVNEVNRRLADMGKIDKYMDALYTFGDGRYHYYDGKANGIGCSEYTRLALLKAGIIKDGETFHAGSGNVGVLADTTRFQKIKWDAKNLRRGDILWSQGHHVATWDGVSGVYEAAPESTHGICDNGKTGVGHWSQHTYYNCGTGQYTWTCIYRIKEMKRTLYEEAQYMIDNDINGKNRYNQCVADGFKYEDVQAEIDKILGKNLNDVWASATKCMQTVQKGTKSASAWVLQQILKDMDYYGGEVNGIADDATIKALKQYQSNINKVYKQLTVDGICGEKTWKRLLLGK